MHHEQISFFPYRCFQLLKGGFATIKFGAFLFEVRGNGFGGGETLEQISARADRFIAKIRATGGDCLAFSSGHFSRVLCARWIGLPADAGRCFVAGTASLQILGYEHNLDEPVVRLWNESCSAK